MNKRHKWADVIIAMANGENIEYEKPWGEFWIEPTDTAVNPISMSHWNWRIKPRTIKIGDMEVPEPLRSFPPGIQIYYVPDIQDLAEEDDALSYAAYFDDDRADNDLLRRGLCHATKADAITHAKALIRVSGGSLCSSS